MASIFDSNPGPLPFQPTGLWGNNFAQYNRPYMSNPQTNTTRGSGYQNPYGDDFLETYLVNNPVSQRSPEEQAYEDWSFRNIMFQTGHGPDPGPLDPALQRFAVPRMSSSLPLQNSGSSTFNPIVPPSSFDGLNQPSPGNFQIGFPDSGLLRPTTQISGDGRGVNSGLPTRPGSTTNSTNLGNQNAPTINPQPNGALGSAFGSALSGSLNQLRNLQQTPSGNTQTTAPTLNSQQQNWMNANSSGWGDDLMNFMLGGGGNQFNFDPMNIQWTNFSNGAQENITRALGIIQSGGANALARILGGTVEASPFATFGTQQRDQMIRMPNGQMIDASAFANALRGASQSSNPFSALSDVIGLYQRENAAFNPQTNTDAVNLVNRGVLNPNAPPGWNPSKFAGGNPTFTPSGPVPGNPSNPGMGTSNPVQFQGGQINGFIGPNGFPVFNTPGSVPQQPSMPQTNTPQMPQPPQFPGTGMNTPQQPAAPQGTNTNWQYYMPQGRQSLFGSPGLYAQPGGGGGGMASGGGMQNPGNGSSGGNTNPANPFGTPRPSNNTQVAGNLPNGSTVLGNR